MKPVVAFLTIAYSLAIGLSLLVGLSGGSESPMIGLGYLSMLIPSFSVAIVRFTWDVGPKIDWRRFSWQYVPLALLLMPVLMHGTMLAATNALEGSWPWQPWLSPQADGLYHTPAERGWGTVPTSGLITRIALNALVGLVVVCLLALFEEIGWRAWLLPRLRQRMSARQAVVATAMLWAFWHVPFALAGVQRVEGLTPLQTALQIPIGILGTGLIIGWFWLRTKSIWIVALAHGSLNNWGQYAFKYMNFVKADPKTILGVGIIAVYVAGLLLLWYALPDETKGRQRLRHDDCPSQSP